MNDTVTARACVPRLHLFEFIDQDWFPHALRDLATDYLHTVSSRLGLFDGATEVLARGLESSGSDALLDLGSGGRGPLPRLKRLLAEKHGVEARVLLSDKYPNAEAAERARGEGVTYLERSVDALQVPSDLRGMRTLFNALHHFRPEEARQVLADAQARGVAIAAFETVRRTPVGVLSMLLVPVLVLLFTPLVRPMTPLRLLLTYGVPVAPLLIFWDGLVSALRVHHPRELAAMTESLAKEGYTWEVGEVKAPGKAAISYVLGMPTK
ncbi:hypothetical protein VZQ01_00085 [Myxococcus faecalis]|uniref:hypothetical protein n=1 Tax=Myxococcus faecalis TaxID=3115646 RepID=UPI003CF0DF5A